MKKCGRDRQHTNDKIIWPMSIACWIAKTAAHIKNMKYLLLFHGNSGYGNAPHCYVYVVCPKSKCTDFPMYEMAM